MREWRRVSLGDVAVKIGSGATPRGGSSVYIDSGVAFIRSQNVHDSRFVSDGLVHIDDLAASALDGVAVGAGDVLLNITGDSVARCCLAPGTVPLARVNQHVMIVRPDPRALNSRYLQALLVEPRMKSRLLALAGAGATRPALTKAHIAGLQLDLPSLPEQRAIAEVLGALDDKIEANRRVSRLLEEHLALAFAESRFDQPADESIPLAKIVEVGPVRPKPAGDGVPYIDMATLPTDSALIASMQARPPKSGTRFVNGDTLMARITPCLENGKVAYVDCLGDDQTGVGSTEFIVLRPREPLPSQFSYFLARSERFSTYAVRHMSGSSGRQRCPVEAVERYDIARPDSADLAKFAALAGPSFAAMRGALNESLILATLRDTLLPKLLSGELQVRDPESLVAQAV
ncbi:MAG: restriction endonuclease subunit S [Actinomycetota bacterium]|nr:restriction endonuclease subunit S [Actinomycetota bacterium]